MQNTGAQNVEMQNISNTNTTNKNINDNDIKVGMRGQTHRKNVEQNNPKSSHRSVGDIMYSAAYSSVGCVLTYASIGTLYCLYPYGEPYIKKGLESLWNWRYKDKYNSILLKAMREGFMNNTARLIVDTGRGFLSVEVGRNIMGPALNNTLFFVINGVCRSARYVYRGIYSAVVRNVAKQHNEKS